MVCANCCCDSSGQEDEVSTIPTPRKPDDAQDPSPGVVSVSEAVYVIFDTSPFEQWRRGLLKDGTGCPQHSATMTDPLLLCRSCAETLTALYNSFKEFISRLKADSQIVRKLEAGGKQRVSIDGDRRVGVSGVKATQKKRGRPPKKKIKAEVSIGDDDESTFFIIKEEQSEDPVETEATWENDHLLVPETLLEETGESPVRQNSRPRRKCRSSVATYSEHFILGDLTLEGTDTEKVHEVEDEQHCNNSNLHGLNSEIIVEDSELTVDYDEEDSNWGSSDAVNSSSESEEEDDSSAEESSRSEDDDDYKPASMKKNIRSRNEKTDSATLKVHYNHNESHETMNTKNAVSNSKVCSDCGKQFNRHSQLRRHCQRIHKKIIPIKKIRINFESLKNQCPPELKACEICNFQVTPQIYEVHLFDHKFKAKSCKTCRQEDRDICNHNLVSQVACEVCGRGFANAKLLRRHRLRIHNARGIVWDDEDNSNNEPQSAATEGKRTFSCFICEKPYSRGVKLKDHLASHGIGELYTCAVCGKGAMGISRYTRHMATHSENKKWKCEREGCNKSYKEKRHLENHLYLHDNPKEPSQKPRTVTCPFPGCNKEIMRHNMKIHRIVHSDNAERIHVCHICGAGFPYRTSLNGHVRYIHGTIARKKCSRCDKTFKNPGHLREHEQLHDMGSARPYVCEVCSGSFRHEKYLKTHMLIHTSKKAISCDICGATFTFKYNLKAHVRTVHEGQPARKKKQAGLGKAEPARKKKQASKQPGLGTRKSPIPSLVPLIQQREPLTAIIARLQRC